MPDTTFYRPRRQFRDYIRTPEDLDNACHAHAAIEATLRHLGQARLALRSAHDPEFPASDWAEVDDTWDAFKDAETDLTREAARLKQLIAASECSGAASDLHPAAQPGCGGGL